MTIKELLKYSDQDIEDIARYNPHLLREIAESSNKSAKRRVKNFLENRKKKENKFKPIPDIYKRGDKSSWRYHKFIEITDKTSKRELKRIAKENIKFLSYKMGTWEGWNNILEKTKKRVFKTAGGKPPKSNVINEFWRIVNLALQHTDLTKYKYDLKDRSYGLSETNKRITRKSAKKELQLAVWEEMQSTPFKGRFRKDIEDDYYASQILERVRIRLTKDYEQQQERERDDERSRGFNKGLTIRRGGI